MAEKRALFRDHAEDVWRQLGDALGAEFVDREGWRKDCVRIESGPWTVTLDRDLRPAARTEVVYTRFRAPYVNADGFRFEIRHQTLLDTFTHLVGMQDVEVGDPEVDRAFVIRASDERKVRRLLASDTLRRYLKSEPGLHLFVRDSGDWFAEEYPDGVDELVLEVEDEVNDLERLRRLYNTFAETLHRLAHIGSAYEKDPGIED